MLHEDANADEDEGDAEWKTIKGFFKSEMQTLAIIKNVDALVHERRICPDYYSKAAAIFEVVYI